MNPRTLLHVGWSKPPPLQGDTTSRNTVASSCGDEHVHGICPQWADEVAYDQARSDLLHEEEELLEVDETAGFADL